jgi:hypothetical protein
MGIRVRNGRARRAALAVYVKLNVPHHSPLLRMQTFGHRDWGRSSFTSENTQR